MSRKLLITTVAAAVVVGGGIAVAFTINGSSPATTARDTAATRSVATVAATATENRTIPLAQTVRLRVKGMYCASCPFIVRQAIARVPGVVKVEVSVVDKTATVAFDAKRTTVAQIAAASTGAGYPATPVAP